MTESNNTPIPEGQLDRFLVPDADPAWKYRWMNDQDRRMSEIQYRGWTPVVDIPKPGTVSLTPPALIQGQSTNNPSGGVIRRRGDVILMRMPREQWENSVKAQKDDVRERQHTVFDTMVDNANQQAREAMINAGYKGVPRKLVFQEEAGAEIGEAAPTKG